MKHRWPFAITIILGLALTTSSFGEDDQVERPNIIFFYADDLGYGDLACYGSQLAQTPRLDMLAREGTRFTQFYVSHCVCSPTRASAITGQFPGRHRIYGHIAFFEQNRRRKMPDWLDVAAPSLPRALQKAGYRTAMIGKWHLGGGSGRTFKMEGLREPGRVRSKKSDKIVINHPDAPPVAQYGFDHVRTTFGNSPTWKDAKPWPEPHETYPYACREWSTWSSRAIADETIGFLKEHVNSTGDQPFYANVWFKDVHVILRPTDEMRKPFRHLDEKPQVHYAMVRYMDQQIGRVLDTLDELGLSENTLVLFSSDNGAGKGRGGSCGPLRGWKHSLYEGGIRVPFIVRWPGQVPAGRVDEQSVLNICDLIPTFCKWTGAEIPAGYESDGEDMTEALRGGPFERSKPQFWHYPTTSPSLAVRIGDWKLLTNPDGQLEELYNLADDISETTNLARDRSDIVRSLKDPLLKWYDGLPIARESK
jgi:N-acetylgalactosamine-6-sulfatase